MAAEVLRRCRDNQNARSEMQRHGLDFTSRWTVRLLQKLHLIKGVSIGDSRKSWDVWKTAQFLEGRVEKSAPILDIGAYASEILCVLHKLKFSDLTGVDLNPGLHDMPLGDAVKYVTADFMQTQFIPDAFAAITAISVLEHGYCAPKMLGELSRILKKGGYLIFSVDYWPNKIDTTGVQAFGMNWRIFSMDEVLELVRDAQGFGLEPVGQLNLEAAEPTVKWCGKRYTFAWLALQKVR